MLIIAMPTWQPGQRNELLRKRMEKGISIPDSRVTMPGEWTDLYGKREIMLLESNDHQDLIAGAVEWSDPIKVEAQPV